MKKKKTTVAWHLLARECDLNQECNFESDGLFGGVVEIFRNYVNERGFGIYLYGRF